MHGDRVVFVFAHQDDEYAAAPWIELEQRSGAEAFCVYLTDGARNVSPEIRNAESIAALSELGVAKERIAFLGEAAGIHDGDLARNSTGASQVLEAWLGSVPNVQRVYTLAWEGGHPDHDAAHLVTLLAAMRRGIANDSWSFSLYNAFGSRGPLFRTLVPIPAAHMRTIRHRAADAWRLALLCRHYPSQRRTWLGLFPGAFVQRFIRRVERAVRFDPDRVTARPHAGVLLYERIFDTPYEQFLIATASVRGQIAALQLQLRTP